MSRGVYVRGVSVQEGICPGVSVRGVHVRGGFVLSPLRLSLNIIEYLKVPGSYLSVYLECLIVFPPHWS